MQKKNSVSIFLIGLLIIYYFSNVIKVLPKRPETVHMWAMCDRASVARNYAEEDMNFFKPRVHYTRADKGITGIEFPMMNYIAAICYKMFGFNEIWYRLSMLIVLTAGLTAAFLLSQHFIKKFVLSSLLVYFFYLSPVLVYYSASFLPDTASLGFILIAWHFIYKYFNTHVRKYLWLFAFFALIATLIKLTSFISITVIILLFIGYKFSFSIFQKLFERKDENFFIGIIITQLVLILTWYLYSGYLNDSNNRFVFLMGLNYPRNFSELKESFDGIKSMWLFTYYPQPFYWSLLVTFLILIFFYKKAQPVLLTITILLWMGNILFIALMFNQFRVHDYYIVALLPAAFFQLLTSIHIISGFSFIKQKQIIMLSLILFTFVILATVRCYKHQRFRYDVNSWIYNFKEFLPYQHIESYLKSIGINRNTHVISIYDPSMNITLYFMNVKGWRIKNAEELKLIPEYIKDGAEYLIVNDTSALNSPIIQLYKNSKKGQFANISIYSVK